MKLNHLTPAGYRQNPDQFVALFNKLIDRVNSDETTKVATTGGSSYKLPAATRTSLGGVIVGDGLTVDGNGLLAATGTETVSYNDLEDKPQINNYTLQDNKSLEDLNINRLTNSNIDDIINSVV